MRMVAATPGTGFDNSR